MEKVVIYARVSTNDQTTENQILKLRTIVKKNDWELTEIYVDEGISGAKGRDKRPEFDRVCKDMVRRKFDRILVWDVSRLGRSLQHLVEFLNEALTTRTDLYIHQSDLDTSTPSGRMMFQIIGVFSEFERTVISSRVKAGLSRVKNKGKKLGRPWGIWFNHSSDTSTIWTSNMHSISCTFNFVHLRAKIRTSDTSSFLYD